MKQPLGFEQLCGGLHQDAMHGISTIDQLAARCLEGVTPPLRADLLAHLDKMVAELTDAEAKGQIHRCAKAIFGSLEFGFDTRGARQFLDAVRDELRKPRVLRAS